MPKYTFKCESCGSSKSQFATVKTKIVDCVCGKTMNRQLPSLLTSNKTELVDKYKNISQRENQKEELQERRDKFYWEVEVPRMVNSGTYSLETMMEQNWVYVDDNNEIHINNKPLAQRSHEN